MDIVFGRPGEGKTQALIRKASKDNLLLVVSGKVDKEHAMKWAEEKGLKLLEPMTHTRFILDGAPEHLVVEGVLIDDAVEFMITCVRLVSDCSLKGCSVGLTPEVLFKRVTQVRSEDGVHGEVDSVDSSLLAGKWAIKP
jgi:hypothetical protein